MMNGIVLNHVCHETLSFRQNDTFDKLYRPSLFFFKYYIASLRVSSSSVQCHVMSCHACFKFIFAMNCYFINIESCDVSFLNKSIFLRRILYTIVEFCFPVRSSVMYIMYFKSLS